MIIFEIFLIDSAFLPNATKVWQSSTTCGYQFYHKIPPPFDITFKIKCNYWYISLMFVWQCIILVQRCKQPTRYNNFRSLIFLNQPYMFRATNSPILRNTFYCIYSFWYNAPTLLPTVATVDVEPVGSSVGALYQKLYIQSKSAREDGRICRPKRVGLI